MQVHIDYLGNNQFHMMAEGLRMDWNRGQTTPDSPLGQFFSPSQEGLATVGIHAGLAVADYCRDRRLDPTDLSLQVSDDSQNSVTCWLLLDVSLPIYLDEDHRQGILQAVHRSLHEFHPTAVVNVQLHSAFIAPNLVISEQYLTG